MCLFVACGENQDHEEYIVQGTPPVVYPKYRKWNSPACGEEPKFNSPSFEWPAEKGASYELQFSTEKDFSRNLFHISDIRFGIFNLHRVLSEGIYYWRVRPDDKLWGEIDSFKITANTPVFDTPEVQVLIDNIPSSHPRVLIDREHLRKFRGQSKTHREAQAIIEEANRHLGKRPPKEKNAFPTLEGKDDFQNNKLELDASKALGDQVGNKLMPLIQAYLITGDQTYFNTAKLWMLEVATWDPKGPTRKNNFGDSFIMVSLALGVDAFWDLLTPAERKKLSTRPLPGRTSFTKGGRATSRIAVHPCMCGSTYCIAWCKPLSL